MWSKNLMVWHGLFSGEMWRQPLLISTLAGTLPCMELVLQLVIFLSFRLLSLVKVPCVVSVCVHARVSPLVVLQSITLCRLGRQQRGYTNPGEVWCTPRYRQRWGKLGLAILCSSQCLLHDVAVASGTWPCRNTSWKCTVLSSTKTPLVGSGKPSVEMRLQTCSPL